MTESEWRTCDDFTRMVECLPGPPDHRKLRLFVCACCRMYPECTNDDKSRSAIETAERFADGIATSDDLSSAYRIANEACTAEWSTLGFEHPDETDIRHGQFVRLCFRFGAAECAAPDPAPELSVAAICSFNEGYWNALLQLAWAPNLLERAASAFREIFGNPYRTKLFINSWATSDVSNLAWQIYESRAFHSMPELAVALEKAGCDDRELLDHCRMPAEHYRGCWGLDLVLGTRER